MKRCPTCNRTFDEDWLAFCTEDGATLVDALSTPPPSEPPPTMRISAAPQTDPSAQPTLDLPGSYTLPKPAVQAWQPPPPPSVMTATGQKQGLALAALVLGIFSMTAGWCCSIGLLSAPVGIILGIISLVQIKNDPAQNTGKPLSIIGIALSAFYLVVWIVIFLIYGFAIFMGSLGNH